LKKNKVLLSKDKNIFTFQRIFVLNVYHVWCKTDNMQISNANIFKMHTNTSTKWICVKSTNPANYYKRQHKINAVYRCTQCIQQQHYQSQRSIK